MSELILARHAETAPNRDRRLLGRFDPPLTEEGDRQAHALARALAHRHPAAVVASPMTRTRQTAEIVAAACGLDVEVDDRLLEIDYGEFDGVPLDDIPRHALQAMRDDPGFAPSGGESMHVVSERIGSWCDDHLREGGEGPVVGVTHMSPIKAALAWALGVPANVGFRSYLGLASITRVGGRAGAPILLSYNEEAHLGASAGPSGPGLSAGEGPERG